MANREESHLFSLSALTTRAPAPPLPASAADDDGSVAFDTAPEHRVSALGAGFSLFPLGAPLGNHEPLAPSAVGTALPKPEANRRRSLALVGVASLLGAGIVLVAVWSSQSPEPPASLARPEVLTQALVPPAPTVQSSPTLPPLPEPTPPEPGAERASTPENPSGSNASQPNRRAHSRPNANQARTRPPAARATAPTPAPVRGACAHCSPSDLACNIKCRAK